MFDAFQDAATTPLATGDEADTSTSPFGDIASYMICGCCGRFHSVVDDGTGGLGNLNSDDRGGLGSNNKPSYGVTQAGAQITRSNATWAAGLGQATTVNYAFRGEAPTTMPSDISGFSSFSAQQIAITLQSLQSWSDVANITFNRVQDAGSEYVANSTISSNGQLTMLFGNYTSGQSGAAAFAYLPGNRASSSNSGDVWVNITASSGQQANPQLLNYGFQTLTHEIGHAIGLSHPADYNAGAGVTITYSAHAIYYEDSRQYSVMSYFDEVNTGAQFGNLWSAAPLLDDIAAAQRLYGANMTTRTGNTTYGFNSNADRAWFSAATASTQLIFAVWDAGGTDTFDFSGYSQNATIDLRQGAFSSVGGLVGNISIGMGAVIENAIGGSGNDTIYGNSANNTIRGGLGNDIINGGLGTDTVIYSGQRSQYTVTWNYGYVTIEGPEGTDTLYNVEWIYFGNDFAEGVYGMVPSQPLNVYGDASNDVITGTALGDTITGGGGDDTINGLGGNDSLGGGSGNDTIDGGAGNDIIVGGLGNDTLTGGAGFDVLDYSSASGAVTVNMTTGLTTGAAGSDSFSAFEEVRGSAFNDTITGDGQNNVLRGGGGIDLLNGGAGNDTLVAGAGVQNTNAADISKPQSLANNSIANARVISSATDYDLLINSAITASTSVPHATVVAVSHGGIEYYRIDVTAAGAQITLDTDNANFDSTLRLLDANGAELASNDDGGSDGASTESFITYTFAAAGTYFVEVARYSSGGTSGAPLVTQSILAGSTYTLHVSLTSATASPIFTAGSTLNGEAGDDTFVGGSGNDAFNGGAGVDTADYSLASAAVTANLATGTASANGQGSDTLSSIERLIGSNFADSLSGSAANETFRGGAGGDAISAGDGYDVSEYAGMRRGYTVVNSTTVTGGTEGGTDSLSGIEAATFVDGMVTFNADSQAAQLMRLYSAAFDRAPDALGFHIQLNALEAGVTTAVMAQRFLDSAEFSGRFGTLTNTQYIQRLYQNALDRQPSNSEINDWLTYLNGGGTRAGLLLIFAESTEHRAITGATLNQGLWVGDDTSEALARLFDVVSDSVPNQVDFTVWRGMLASGQSLANIAATMLQTQGYYDVFAGLTNEQFVTKVYQQAFERAPDAAGFNAYVTGLTNGTITRAQMLVEFANSAEHVALTTPRWVGGIPFQGAPTAPDDVAKAEDVQAPQVQPEIDGGKDAGKAEDGALVLPDQTDGDAFVLPARPAHGASAVDGVRLTEPQVQIELTTEEAKAEVALVLPDDAFVLTKADMDAQPLVLPDAGTETLELSSEAPAAVDPLADLPFIERPDLPVHFDPLDLLVHRDHGPWAH